MSARRGGIAGSSAVMFAGTLVSRLLGMVKSPVLLGAAIGLNTGAANSFSVANKLPNLIYMLIAGGVLNAVLVPQIVRAVKENADGGQEYVNRLLTLAVVGLAAVTTLLTLASPLLISLYASGLPDQWYDLAVTFGYWCIPQLFFYGLYTLLGQVLNARGIFGPYMWAPVLNNVVAITGLCVYLAVFGGVSVLADPADASIWTENRLAILAGTATLGIIAQALVLLVPLRRAGFHYRPVWGIRGSGLGRAGRIATWVFAALAANQAAYVVVSNAAARASRVGGGALDVPGNAAYDAAFLVYTLPTSLVVVSLVTALFTRMSEGAAVGDPDKVRADLSVGLRTVGVFTVIAAGALMVLALPVVRVVSPAVTYTEVQAVARVLVAMLGGLVAVGVFTVCQRVYYAFEDARGLFRLQLPMVVVLAVGAALSMLLPPEWTVVGVGVAMTLSNWTGAILTYLGLRRHLRTTDGSRVLRTHLRLVMSAVPAALLGWGLMRLLGSGGDVLSVWGALWRIAVVGAVMAVVYVVLLRALDVSELDTLARPVGRLVAKVGRKVPGPAGRVLVRVGTAIAPAAAGSGSSHDDGGPGGPEDGPGAGPGGPGGGPAGPGGGPGPDGGRGPDGGHGGAPAAAGGVPVGPGAVDPEGDAPVGPPGPGAGPGTGPGPLPGAGPADPQPGDPAEESVITTPATPAPSGETDPSASRHGAATPPGGVRTLGGDDGRFRAAADVEGTPLVSTDQTRGTTRALVLGGRYDLERPLPAPARDAERWLARDAILDRWVEALVLTHARPDVLDAARRAALVQDHRLSRVLDVGGFYVVTDVVSGPHLGELAARGPIAPDQARAVVGEAASALESARRHGVRHLVLRPENVHITPDGQVLITGLGTEATLIGADLDDDPLAADRRDAAGLVGLLYLALTGKPAVPGAPRPRQVRPEIPADLDELCARTLRGSGPRSTGELIRDLAPWRDIDPSRLPREPLPQRTFSPLHGAPSNGGARLTAMGGVPVSQPAPRSADPTQRPTSSAATPASAGTPVLPAGGVPAAGGPSGPTGSTAEHSDTLADQTPDADAVATAAAITAAAGAAAASAAGAVGAPVPAWADLPGGRPPGPRPGATPPRPEPTWDAIIGGPAAPEDLRARTRPTQEGKAPRGLAHTARATGAVAAPKADAQPATPPPPPPPAPPARPTAEGWAPQRPSSSRPPAFDQILGTEPAPEQAPARHTQAAGALAGFAVVAADVARAAAGTVAEKSKQAAAGTKKAAVAAGEGVGTAARTARSNIGPALTASKEKIGPTLAAGKEKLETVAAKAPAAIRVRPADREGPADDQDMLPHERWSDVDGPEVPFAERRMNPTPIVLVAVAALVLVLFLVSLRTLFAPAEPVALPEVTPPRPTATAQPTPEPTQEPAPEPTEAPPAPAATPVVASLAPLDPQGDGAENPEITGRALDGDPTSFWRSRSYVNPEYGMKEGIGLHVALQANATVSRVEIDLRGTGGLVQIRATDPATPTQGDVLAEGEMGPGSVFTFAQPVETQNLVLWFPRLPTAESDGANRLEIAEIRVG